MSASPDPDFEGLVQDMRDRRGFDFTGYKRSSLERRIRKRMGDVGIDSFAEYRDYLEVHVDEFGILFDTILINVTKFFRDVDTWRYLQREVVSSLVEERADGGEIRVWSAGCSSGEEAYSLAIVFCEVLGEDGFRDRVKIYATDVDEGALHAARLGIYTPKKLDGVNDEWRGRYFEPSGNDFQFRTDLRRRVIFGRHDITQDAPISRLDLLACRNTLMYFNAEAQGHILSRFHFALREGGYLFLGKAEMLLSDGDRFVALSMPHRLFVRAPGPTYLPRDTVPLPHAHPIGDLAKGRQLREMVLEGGPTAQIAIDLDGNLVMANNQARAMFAIHSRDIGRPLRDHEVSYRPIELRSLVEQALSERRPVRANGIERRFNADEAQYLDVQVSPVIGDDGMLIGTGITFTDVSAFIGLQREVRRVHGELETANEELQSTNEELETTNEELQSSNEELETTNEELQSTNEELETTNEELQSSNEELETMNEELRVRTAELDETNSFLGGVLTGLHVAVVVLDSRLDVRAWNPAAADLWGRSFNEVEGRPFFGLDLLAPISQLRDPVRACLDGSSDRTITEMAATDRRGHAVRCRVTVSPLGGREVGVVLLMDVLDR
ncbi:MAG TPA: CheR family methyltransferase [Acidimicrobiales bacterium]|nr:CheR family methyltransferase [Acidimicrobiales bacterium]